MAINLYLNKAIKSLFSGWQWGRDPMFQRFWIDRFFDSQTPVIIDQNDLEKSYLDCPHLRAVIDKRGEFLANGQWKCVDVNDEKKEYPDDAGLKLLKKPNVFQSGEDFLKDYLYFKDVYANSFIYKNAGSSLAVPRALWNLPSEWMELKLSNKFFDQVAIEEIIKEFRMCYGTYVRKYETRDIIYKPERFSFSKGKGVSKIPTLQLPISNIIAALKTRNIIIVNKGQIGFMSSEGKDVAGVLPMKSNQREGIEKQFEEDTNLYSEKPKIKVVTTPARWNPMSFPMKDLALFEEIEDDFSTICSNYGVMRDVFPSIKGATFENQKEAKKGTYTDTIQPEADALAEMMTEHLQPGPGKKYILDYSWMPIMQADKQKEETADKTKAEKNAILLDKGIIDDKAFAESMGVKLTGSKAAGGDIGQGELGKLPLAMQQLALARQRAKEDGDTDLFNKIGAKLDELLASF